MMLLRLSTLATGHTGIRPETAQTMAAMLTHGITPIVHAARQPGLLGRPCPTCTLRAGDGRGHGPRRDGKLCPAAEALADVGLRPVELAAKEGLALINGTDGMLGMLILAQADLAELLKVADIAAAMSVEALLGRTGFRRRPPGPAAASGTGGQRGQPAPHPRGLCHRGKSPRSRLHGGPGRVLLEVFPAGHRSGPRYAGPHPPDRLPRTRIRGGQPGGARRWPSRVQRQLPRRTGRPCPGLPCDPVADVASMSERRTDRFDASRSNGLPAFLADDPGVDSGHMIAQYTQASIVSELKRLAVPASVDSIPSSAMQEDHVAMGWSAARKLRRAISDWTQVLAIEILTAARGLELRRPLTPAAATAAVVATLRGAGRGAGDLTASSPRRSRPP